MRCWRFAAAGGGSKPFTTKRVSRADEGPLRKKCYRHCKRSGRGSQKQNWLIFVSSFSFFFLFFCYWLEMGRGKERNQQADGGLWRRGWQGGAGMGNDGVKGRWTYCGVDLTLRATVAGCHTAPPLTKHVKELSGFAKSLRSRRGTPLFWW